MEFLLIYVFKINQTWLNGQFAGSLKSFRLDRNDHEREIPVFIRDHIPFHVLNIALAAECLIFYKNERKHTMAVLMFLQLS